MNLPKTVGGHPRREPLYVMTDTICYGQWECESCQDIFVAETVNEEHAICPACDLECMPHSVGGGIYTLIYDDKKPDAAPKTFYMFASEAPSAPMIVLKWDGNNRTCSCDSLSLFNLGCKCGGV